MRLIDGTGSLLGRVELRPMTPEEHAAWRGHMLVRYAADVENELSLSAERTRQEAKDTELARH